MYNLQESSQVTGNLSTVTFTSHHRLGKNNHMETFGEKLSKYLSDLPNTLYEISLDVGLDPSNVDKILYAKRKTTFDKRLEVLQKLSTSSLVNMDFSMLSWWLARDYLPESVFKAVMDDIDRLGADVVHELAEEELKKRKGKSKSTQ